MQTQITDDVKKVRPCIFDCKSEMQEDPHLATDGEPSVMCDEATSLRRSVLLYG